MPIADLNFLGLDIRCLLSPHEWSTNFVLIPRFPSDVTAGETDREGRRAEDEALRFNVQLHLLTMDADAQALRVAKATLGTGWVGVPVWPDRQLGATWADRALDPQVLIDLTAVALVAHDAVLDPTHTYAPLLVGHVDTFGETSVLTRGMGDEKLVITGDAPWEFRIGVNAVVASGTFPESLAPSWVSEPIERALQGVTFEQIGEQRVRMAENVEKPFKWAQDAEFLLASRADLRTFLGFFLASQGPRKNFDQPWWFTPGDATPEAPATTKARFASESVELQFETDSVARVVIQVVQVPWEIVGVGGETPPQPPRVYYYKLTHRVPTPQIWRFTNWPRALTRAGDGDYVPSSFKHQEISEGIDFYAEEVTIDSFVFDGNPLNLLVPFQLEGPLDLEIWEGETDPIDPDAATLRWTGEIKRAQQVGRRITAIATFLGGLPSLELPPFRICTTCNTNLFEPACGLLAADYEQAGTLTAKVGMVLTITTAAANAADYFANGWIEMGAGATFERRNIIASSPVAGGQQLVIDWPLRQAAAAQAVRFWPGCSLTKANCQLFAGNWKTRFLAYPNLPQVNLSLPSFSMPGSGGKK
jgi:hypothetical protein